jgi:predicted nuclease with TOPRIM domain
MPHQENEMLDQEGRLEAELEEARETIAVFAAEKKALREQLARLTDAGRDILDMSAP